MKKGFVNTIGFKLIVLLFVIFTTMISASLMFNSQIDKLKAQIDNIYFGNFIPVLKLQNVVNNYRDLVFCIKKREFNCSIKTYEQNILQNWEYYNGGYKTGAERAVVDSVDNDIGNSLKVKRLKNLYAVINKIDFLMNYETQEAQKQRKEFLFKYDKMKDYLFYNIIAIVVFSLIIIVFILLIIALMVVTFLAAGNKKPKTIYLKPKGAEKEKGKKKDSDETEPEVEKQEQEEAPAPAPRPDEDAMRSELRSLRQTAVSLTIGEKEGASALIKEWLEDNPNKSDDGEEEAGEE